MAHYGVLIGVLLLVVVTGIAVLLARQAEKGVERYREDTHERFTGRGAK